MTKHYDAKTLLQNMCFDVERMLRDGTSSKEVVEYIQAKMDFITKERKEEIIRWWDE